MNRPRFATEYHACGWTWEDIEKDYLKQHYHAAKDAPAIAEYLGRSVTSVKHMANAMGLLECKKWNSSDDMFLRHHFSDMPTNDIAAHLEKSVNQVRAHAYKLGLLKHKRNSML